MSNISFLLWRQRKTSRVLITDAHLKASLAVIRSLGKKNIHIAAGSEIKSAIGLHSKFCSKKFVYPNPRINVNDFLQNLLRIVKQDQYDCIIPTHTYTAFILAKFRDLFSNYTKIPPPDFQVFINAFDKQYLLNTAMKNNVACPRTYSFNPSDEGEDVIEGYPVIIKPARRHGIKIEICHTPSALRNKFNAMSRKYGPCIVQDYVPNGGELGVYTLFNDKSEPLALTVQKRLRSLNSYGGISTLRETVKNDALVDIAFHLLKTIRWSGVAMVEFRIDARDGIPKLMEINPRFWGSLQLSILSGVDFPYLFYKNIMHEEQTSTLHFKEGVQCRWFTGEISRLFSGSGKLQIIRDVLQPCAHDDIISLKDPKPMIASVFSPWDSSDDEPRDDSFLKNDEISIINLKQKEENSHENIAHFS